MATGLLLLAAAVFIAVQFLPPTFTVRLVGAAAEAALVGGLADWFAVTALFRRPLGLPIPHTALIPSRKDDIGRALGSFVRDNFLAPDLIIRRLRAENRALQLARWLDSDTAAAFIAERALILLPVVLDHADDDDIRRFVGDIAQESIRRIDPAPIIDVAIDALLQSGKHMTLVDAAADLVAASLGTLEAAIVEKVGEQTGRFFPTYFDRKIGRGVVHGTQKWLETVRDVESPERRQIDGWIRQRLAQLRVSPGYGALVGEVRDLAVANPALVQLAVSAWDETKREILNDLRSPAPQIGQVIVRAIRKSGALLAAAPSLQHDVNAAIERLVVDYIAPWRSQISDFIADVVRGWDARTVTERIELEVGSDLQFVRMNGTVVGAIIGMTLFLISAAAG